MGCIFVTDCSRFLETCEPERFDLIIADPPYFQICGEFDYVWPNREAYCSWCQSWLGLCAKALKPTGSLYLWGKIGFGKGFPLFHVVNWIEETNLFRVVNWITQRNTRGRGNKRGYMEAREELIFMVKGNDYTWNCAYTEEPSKRKDLGFDGKPRKNTHKRCSDVWIDIAEASQSAKERTGFPTTKALRLCERIVLASTNPGDEVYIPFGGSGSEAIACEKHGRRWVLTEKEPQYVERFIVPRLDNHVPLESGTWSERVVSLPGGC